MAEQYRKLGDKDKCKYIDCKKLEELQGLKRG